MTESSKENASARFGGFLEMPEVLEIWKHFASLGSEDKARMVTVTTWLLTFSAAIIGYVGTNFVDYNRFCISEPKKTAVLIAIGLVISLVGTFVVLLYAGYSNWNWAWADEIAEKYGLANMLTPGTDRNWSGVTKSVTMRILINLARPRDPKWRLPPVFWVFLIVSVSCVLITFSLLALSVVGIRTCQ